MERARASGTGIEISGVVMDPLGEGVAQAEIVVRAISYESTFEADNDGRFHLSDLDPGVYDIRVWSEGFKTAERDTLAISAGERLKLETVLEIGDIGGGAPIRRGFRAIPGNPLRWPAAFGRWIRRKLD